MAVKREGYPEEAPLLETTATKELHMMSQPAHTLTIMYPVMLVNLLPCDLSYQVKNIPAKGNIKAGKSVPLYTVSTIICLTNTSWLGFSLKTKVVHTILTTPVIIT